MIVQEQILPIRTVSVHFKDNKKNQYMNQLTIYHDEGLEKNWLIKAWKLKKTLNLRLSEVVFLCKELRKGKTIIIRPLSEGFYDNGRIENAFFELTSTTCFYCILEIVKPQDFVSYLDYNLYIKDYVRGFKIFISNDLRR